MSTTEAPFVVSHNFCAIRAENVDELEERLQEFVNNPGIPDLIAEFRGVVSRVTPAGSMQDARRYADAGSTAGAVATLAQGGITGTVVPDGGIEERTDRWGNRFVKGEPTGQFCEHGERVAAYKKSKAGKSYKAFVCVNDSPFGNYQNGKCDQTYPER